MSIASVVRALVDAGATPQMILAAVEAAEAANTDKLAQRRASDAARQQAARDRKNNVKSRDVTVTVRDAEKPSRVVLASLPSLRSEELDTPFTHPSGAFPQIAKPNGFGRFWEAYPNKTGKGAAEKAYAKAIRFLSGHDPPGQLLDAVARAKLGRQWGEGFVPNPATWLNQRRWEDEIEPPRTAHDLPRSTAASAKRSEREANMARAFAGAEAASRIRKIY